MKGWICKGFLAIMDQGLFATSNFLINILLARWLTPQDYGAFVVAYTIFWMLGIFHAAFLTEPMLVFGPGRYKDNYPEYFKVLLYGNWYICALISILLLVGGYILRSRGMSLLALPLWILALTGPFMLLQSSMRRICYVLLKPNLAAYAGALYLSMILIGATFLTKCGWLSAISALILMGTASLASSSVLQFQIKPKGANLTRQTFTREVLENHWRYGKWAVGSGLMVWIPGNLFNLVLPFWGGLEASALFRALINLILLPMQMISALGNGLVPSFVKAREHSDFLYNALKLLVCLLFITIGYWVGLGLYGNKIMIWLYQGKFTQGTDLLQIIGIIPVFQSLIMVWTGIFLAYNEPRIIFWSYICSTVVVLLLGVSLTARLGVSGAGLAMVAAYATTASVLTIMHSKKILNGLRSARG